MDEPREKLKKEKQQQTSLKERDINGSVLERFKKDQ